MSNFLPRRIWGFNFFRKTLVLGLSLAVALVSVSLIDQKLHLFTTAKKMAGEIAGVTIENANKFLSVGLAGAQASTAYQKVSGDVNISGNVGISGTHDLLRINTSNSGTTATNYIRGTNNHMVINANGSLYLNYPENGAGMTRIGETLFIQRSGNVGVGINDPGEKLDVVGNIKSTGQHFINNTGPTVYLQDTDNRSAMIHTNSNNFYVLRGSGTNSTTWQATGGYWPLQIDLENNNTTIGGNLYLPGGGLIVGGNGVIDSGGGWHRSYGNTGWYNNTYGGGWYMTDSTWIRSYGDKHIYIGGRAYTTSQIQIGGNPHAWTDRGCTNCGDSINGSPQLWLTSQTGPVNVRTAGGGNGSGGGFTINSGLQLGGNPAGWTDRGCAWCQDAINGNSNLWLTAQNQVYVRSPNWNQNDVAELFPITDDSDTADLVAIVSGKDGFAMKKASGPYDPLIAGVISETPAILFDGSGLIMGWDPNSYSTENISDENEIKTLEQLRQQHQGKKPVALAGRIPLKVSSINGPIQPGDPITSSAIPGVGMKATKPGQIVGRALESFDLSTTNPCPDNPQYQCGKVLIFTNVSWYDPDVYLASTKDFKLNLDTLKDAGNNLITRIGAFAGIIAGKIQAGIIETQRLIVNGVDILERLDSLSQKVETQQQEIESLKREIQQLKAR